LERLEECATRCGSRASLARRAGLTPGSVQNYFDGGEPSRRTLVDLARAAAVAVEWLATGEGEQAPDAPPVGYVDIGSFDLAATGSHIRGILDHFGQHPRRRSGRLLKKADVIGRTDISLESYIVENSGLEFEPDIKATDVFLFSVPHGHQVVQPSDVESWTFINEQSIYLAAIGAELKLRKLRRQKESIQVIAETGKAEMALTGRPRDFVLFGPVVWRAGSLPLTK
jgi:hypothetical protein